MSKSSRKRYQAKRRAYKREEPIDRRNVYGLPDPTPYEAMRKIIEREKRSLKNKIIEGEQNMRSIIIRKSYYSGIKELSPENRLEVYDAIMHSAFENTPPDISTLSNEARSVAACVIDCIEADYKRFLEKRVAKG
nr:MAG TPA: hypothetical protein [Caudoviricetes sp.]